MNRSDQLLFAALNLPELDRDLVVHEVGNIPDSNWVWDSYRTTWMVPMMTASGSREFRELNSQDGQFHWTDFAPKALVNYLEENVFNWLRPKPRIMILKTPSGQKNREHIDCVPGDFGTRQHKFRMVLQGRSDSLYFITSKGRVHVPETDRPFLIDGGWPHGMENNFVKDKITLCIGAPWTGSDSYPEFSHLMSRDEFEMPTNYAKYFERPPD